MNISSEEFESTKQHSENTYRSIPPTYCPYFKESIIFNTAGLEHLKFKQRGKARSVEDQYMRFKLLHIAPEVIRASHTLQGKLEQRKFERIRVHGRTDTVLKLVTYYEFIALIHRNRVKIIIKQIENSEKFFWSIIPFWGMDTVSRSRIFHEGFPEED